MAALKDEMANSNISILDIQIALRCSEKTARNKVNGRSAFTYPEASKIRNLFFPSQSMEYLFGEEQATAQEAS